MDGDCSHGIKRRLLLSLPDLTMMTGWLTEPLEHPASQPSQGILGTALCAIGPLFTRGNRLMVGHEIRVEPVLSPPLSCLPRSYGRAALSWWGQGPGVPMLAVGLASEHLWQGARNVGMDPGTCVLRRVFSQAIKKQKLVSIMMN